MSFSLKILYIIVSAVFLAAFTEYSVADDARVHLEKGLRAYNRDADFDKAINELQKAIELGLSERSDMVQAHLHLGFAYIGLGSRISAVVEFAKAINLDPALDLDPKIYSGKIVSAFNETKASLVDSLTVISTPGEAEVYIDGQKSGITPLKLNSVLAREHILMIVKEFYKPKILDIRVGKGEENRVQVTLEKADLDLRIHTQPSEAAVYVSGKLIGKTPLSIKAFLDQELDIRLAKEEYLDKSLKVKITPSGASISEPGKIFPIKDNSGDINVELLPSPAPGSLSVISEPSGAGVYLDGIAIGNTPLIVPKVTPGGRELRVSIPSFDSLIQKVEIIGDKETSVNAILGGEINISSFPQGAQVYIDGVYSGLTPIKTDSIPTGSHQIRLAKERYTDREVTVILERGQEKELNIRLIPMKGSIAISSDPPDMEVYLDDEFKGNTPIFIYGVIAGQHKLKYQKNGFYQEKIVTVREYEVLWQFFRQKN